VVSAKNQRIKVREIFCGNPFSFLAPMVFKLVETNFNPEGISADFLRILRKSAGNNFSVFISRRLAQNTQKIRRIWGPLT